MTDHPVDALVLPLGFEIIKASRLVQRYQKMIDGRRVILHYQRITESNRISQDIYGVRNYVHSSLRIFVDAPVLRTRVRLSHRDVGGKPILSKLQEVAADGDLADRFIFGLSPEWTELLVHDSSTQDLILSLTAGVEGIGSAPALQIQPGTLLSMGKIFHEQVLTQDYVRQRMDDMVALAKAAEALPQTYTPTKQTRSDSAVVEGPSTTRTVITLLVIIAVLAIPALLCVGGTVLLAALQ